MKLSKWRILRDKGNIVIIIVFIIITFIFYKSYPVDFFKMNFVNILTFFIATFFAFHLTQKSNRRQKKKEKAEGLLLKYQKIIGDYKFRCIQSDEDVNDVFMLHRRLSNINTLLNELDLNISDEVNLIKQKTDDHKILLSDHMNDIEYLRKSKNEFNRMTDNIDFNIDKCILKLFEI